MLNIGSIYYIAAAHHRPREDHFAAMSIFRQSKVFFRSNNFFQVLALLSVYVRSHPLGCLSVHLSALARLNRLTYNLDI